MSAASSTLVALDRREGAVDPRHRRRADLQVQVGAVVVDDVAQRIVDLEGHRSLSAACRRALSSDGRGYAPPRPAYLGFFLTLTLILAVAGVASTLPVAVDRPHLDRVLALGELQLQRRLAVVEGALVDLALEGERPRERVTLSVPLNFSFTLAVFLPAFSLSFFFGFFLKAVSGSSPDAGRGPASSKAPMSVPSLSAAVRRARRRPCAAWPR